MMHAFDPETLDPRRAGQVTRYHCWPRHREQSVAEHTWQVIRILLAVWPEAPRYLLVYAMFHDVGEVGMGDVPWPAKNLDPIIQQKFDAGEEAVHRLMCERFKVPEPTAITTEEKKIFKLCEFIEMAEYGRNEFNLGNRYAMVIVDRMLDMAHRFRHELKAAGREDVFFASGEYLHARKVYENDIQEKVL